MVAITGQVAITGSISVTPSYLPVPTFVTTATGSGNNLVTVNLAPQDGGTWGICGYQITNFPSTTSTIVLNTTSAVVVVPNTTTYFKFIVTPYNYVGLGSTATTSTIAAGFLGAAVNSNSYNLPVSPTLSAVPVVVSSSTQTIVITVNSVTNTAPAISTYATDIFIIPGGTTATVLNTNVGIGSGVYNSTGTTSFTGLTRATSYIFSSQAYNAIGYATSATLTTSTYGLPTTPGISAATASAPAGSSQINVTVGATQNLWSLPTIGVIVTASPGGQQKTLVSTNSNTNVVPSSNSTGVLSFTGLTASTAYTFTAQAFNNVGFDTNSTTANASTTVAPGSQLYSTTGPYTFTVPTGVTSVSVVAVGGGGRGSQRYIPGIAGGCSSFNAPTGVVAGGGGAYILSPASPYSGPLGTPPGGTVTVGTGGTGGTGGGGPLANTSPQGRGGGGGGGAGGYAGAGGGGGNGGAGTGFASPGGGGGGGSGAVCIGPALYGGAGGGGVGVCGQGTNGSGGVANTGASSPLGVPAGGGGSGGGSGTNGSVGSSGGAGGCYGGGGGGASISLASAPTAPFSGVGGSGGALAYKNNISVSPGQSIPVVVGVGGGSPASTNRGAPGAVRIIWPGSSRSFPSTCAGAP